MQHPFINTAITAARKAGDIITKGYRRLDLIRISKKNPGDFVTDIDKSAERAIIATLLTAYPNHSILAEESGEMEADSDFQWIIDPLDGTTNFIHGMPHFCVSIALKQKNRIEHGVIYDPIRNELFTATRGSGAFREDRRMRVSAQTMLKDSLLGVGAAPRLTDEERENHYTLMKTLETHRLDIRRTGSSALNLAYIAAGHLDGGWKFGLKPWDMAAGVLMIKEAGGIVTDADGSDDYMNSGNLIAGNPKVFKELLKIIQPFSKK